MEHCLQLFRTDNYAQRSSLENLKLPENRYRDTFGPHPGPLWDPWNSLRPNSGDIWTPPGPASGAPRSRLEQHKSRHPVEHEKSSYVSNGMPTFGRPCNRRQGCLNGTQLGELSGKNLSDPERCKASCSSDADKSGAMCVPGIAALTQSASP